MSRKLSPLAIQSALSQESDQAWLFLLEIRHSSLKNPFRWVNDTDKIVSNGKTYLPYAFEVQLSVEDEEHLPEVELTIDNVDRALMEVIRTSDVAPEFTIRLVLHSTPDVVEVEVVGLSLLEVSYDAYRLYGTLYADDLLNTRYPADIVSIAAGYQGLFRQ